MFSFLLILSSLLLKCSTHSKKELILIKAKCKELFTQYFHCCKALEIMAQSSSVFISSVSQGVTLRAVGFSYAKRERNQLLAGYQGVERWVTKNDYRISIGYTYAEPSKYHAKLAKYLPRNSQKNLLNTCRPTSRKRPFKAQRFIPCLLRFLSCEKTISKKNLLLLIEEFPSLVQPRNAIKFKHLIIQFTSSLSYRQEVKILALKAVSVSYEKWWLTRGSDPPALRALV